MKTLLTAAAAALFAGGALAQDDGGLDAAGAYDANRDRGISQDEFQTGMHQEWRRNAGDAGAMDEQTFEDSMLGDSEDFSAWDANDDDMLSEEEYSEGVFSEYDGDESGLWDEDETATYQSDLDERMSETN